MTYNVQIKVMLLKELLDPQGKAVQAGERFGIIRFGSRVDVYLPEGTEPRVLMGQTIVAGETVLAEIGEAPAIEGVRQ